MEWEISMLMKTSQVVRVVKTSSDAQLSWVALNFLGSLFVFAIRNFATHLKIVIAS